MLVREVKLPSLVVKIRFEDTFDTPFVVGCQGGTLLLPRLEMQGKQGGEAVERVREPDFPHQVGVDGFASVINHTRHDFHPVERFHVVYYFDQLILELRNLKAFALFLFNVFNQRGVVRTVTISPRNLGIAVALGVIGPS